MHNNLVIWVVWFVATRLGCVMAYWQVWRLSSYETCPRYMRAMMVGRCKGLLPIILFSLGHTVDIDSRIHHRGSVLGKGWSQNMS